MCSVDMVIFYYMINIYYQAINKSNANPSSDCVSQVKYLSNSLFVIIPAFCLISTLFLITSAKMFYSRAMSKKAVPIIIYLMAIIIHSILFWYENKLITNIMHHTSQTMSLCIDINTNISVINYAFITKGILFNIVFMITVLYYLCFTINKKKCVIVIIVLSCIILLMSLLLVIDARYIHGIAALFGVLHVKCHSCGHGVDVASSTKTTTYVANSKLECPGGCCCSHGGKGCCEWNFEGGFCVCCYAGCGDYPKSLCFSCCGLISCFCCDSGGCYGAICCSYDFFTWCGCGCC